MRNPLAPTKLVSEDELESIHLASLRVLRGIGVDVLHDEARRIMKAHGADVREGSERVRFDSEMILDLVSPAVGIHHPCPQPGAQCAFRRRQSDHLDDGVGSQCSDMDGGRRPGNQADYRNFLRLAQMHNILHCTGGYPVEPTDIHPSVRHLECIRDLATLTDKVFHIYSLGKERNVDGIEITRIARGVSHEQMLEQPSVFTIINTNSPLKLDVPMMEGIIQMSSKGQVVIVTPFTLSGAMAPVTIAGALVQQNAEALSGIAFAQMVRKGAPGRLWRLHLQCRHEVGLARLRHARIHEGAARRRPACPPLQHPLPHLQHLRRQHGGRAGGLRKRVLAVGRHPGRRQSDDACGRWLEGGLRCSYEKTILDIDLLQMVVNS